jgi:hypothetical protein
MQAESARLYPDDVLFTVPLQQVVSFYAWHQHPPLGKSTKA